MELCINTTILQQHKSIRSSFHHLPCAGASECVSGAVVVKIDAMMVSVVEAPETSEGEGVVDEGMAGIP